jgi:hypothetical protein
MRGIFILLLGIVSGVIATVMYVTLTDLPGEDAASNAGGGNARLSLDEDALARIYEQVLGPTLDPDTPLSVLVGVEDEGLLRITALVGPLGIEEEATLVLNPEVVEGELLLEVVEGTGSLAGGPEGMMEILQGVLRGQLSALAGGLPYRLVSITTRGGQITLEIAV